MSPGEKSGRRQSLPISFITLIARTLQKSLTATESDRAIEIQKLIYSCTTPHCQYLLQELYKDVEYDINIQVIRVEQHSTMVCMLASGSSCTGFNICPMFDPQHSPKKFMMQKLLMLVRLLNGPAKRKVDSGLKSNPSSTG